MRGVQSTWHRSNCWRVNTVLGSKLDTLLYVLQSIVWTETDKNKIKESQNNNNYYKQIARNWYWTRHVQLGNADFSFEMLPRVNAYSRSTDLVMFPCRLRLLVCSDWFNQSSIYTYLWRGTFLMSSLSSIWRFYNTSQLVHIWRGGINSYKIDSTETAGSLFWIRAKRKLYSRWNLHFVSSLRLSILRSLWMLCCEWYFLSHAQTKPARAWWFWARENLMFCYVPAELATASGRNIIWRSGFFPFFISVFNVYQTFSFENILLWRMT